MSYERAVRPRRSHAAPSRLTWLRARGLTIRRKILAAFLVMSAITAALGFYAVHGIVVAGHLVVDTFDHSLISIDYARAAAADFAQMETARARARLGPNSGPDSGPNATMAELAQGLKDDLGIAAERSQSAPARRAARTVGLDVEAWLAAQDRPVGSAPDDPASAALDQLAGRITDQIDLLINIIASDGFRHRQRALATIHTSTRIAIGATLAALMLSGVVTALLARRIMGPVALASAAAGQIASGHLDADIPEAGRDELGALLRAMAAMRDNIRAMMDAEIAQRRSAEAMLVDAIESSREGVAVIDARGRLVIANARMAAFLPHTAGRLTPGAPFAQILGAGVPTADDGAEELALADGRWVRVGRSDTEHGGSVVILSDITALKRQQAALQETNQRFDAALNNMSQGLCLYDADNRLLVSNRRFCELFRLPQAEVRPGRSLSEMYGLSAAAGNLGGMDPDTMVADRLARLAKRVSETYFQELGDHRVIAVGTEPMPDGGWLVTYDDITDRRRAEAQLTFLARHDPLTQLPNRLLFQDRLEQAVAGLGRGAGFAVLHLNLDRFKAVNDAFGNAAGDALLRAAGERLAACVRETDTLARLGADEFAIVLAGLDQPEDAGVLGRRIIAALAEPFALQGEAVAMACSIGIAVAPADGRLPEALLRNAGTAMMRAKLEGGGALRFFQPEMDAKLQARRALEQDLRRALPAGEFEVFYQPLFDLASNRVRGFEALLRWRHPRRGMVSPAEFIPLAEEIGLIVPLGRWVLRTATIQAAGWAEPVRIAVNVSPLQFRDPGLVDSVVAALAESGLPAERLELEITESVLLTDSAAILAVLGRLHGIGVRISMDDFGTGYSSLSYLQSFPFDKIKIDQSFIRDLSGKTGAIAIVRAVIGLGASLGMRVTAEGVETHEQLSRLRAEGCDEIQGYYFSPPRPAAEIPALIARLNDSALTPA